MVVDITMNVEEPRARFPDRIFEPQHRRFGSSFANIRNTLEQPAHSCTPFADLEGFTTMAEI